MPTFFGTHPIHYIQEMSTSAEGELEAKAAAEGMQVFAYRWFFYRTAQPETGVKRVACFSRPDFLELLASWNRAGTHCLGTGPVPNPRWHYSEE